MKQFEINEYKEYIEKHGKEPKLVTRNGRSVRVICTNMKSNDSYIVLGLVLKDGVETLLSFESNGSFSVCGDSINDLFFADLEPVKKRVPLTYDDLLERVRQGKTMWVESNGVCTFISDFYEDKIFWLNGIKDTIDCLMERELYFADGTPGWKEVAE